MAHNIKNRNETEIRIKIVLNFLNENYQICKLMSGLVGRLRKDTILKFIKS